MPVRTAKFIARKNWIIAGTDDLLVRVYNYHTLEKVTQFEAHTDYVRAFDIHPTRPYVLSCSDDMSIRLWDWERGWKCISTFEGHSHYVMGIAFNPKDQNTFASASLDCTIKVWSLASPTANYTLEGHEKGINCLAYYAGGDRPYLVSGADDATLRVWDYQTKSCLRVLEGHQQNVSAVLFHPDLPLILSASEDGAVKVWNLSTFRPEATFTFALDRCWSLAARKGSTEIAVGCDEGAIVFQLGKGEPAASMDANGKLVWARHNEVLTGNVRQVLEDDGADAALPSAEGQRIPLPAKELGHCEIYPQLLTHSPTGRFIAVCGDGEYIIFSALAWRNKAFGKGLELAWASGTNNDFVVRESPAKLAVQHNFAEAGVIRTASACERVFGGVLIGAACAGAQLCFYEWASCQLVCRIDVDAKRLFWSESTRKVAICSEDSIYILQYHEAAINAHFRRGEMLPEDGLEEAFELLEQIPVERVSSGLWIGECFVFMTANHRLCYLVGGQVYQLSIAERPQYLAGFLARENRLICLDKDVAVTSYTLSTSVIDFETAILKGDLALADSLKPTLPRDQLNRVAQFLDARGHKEAALAMASDDEFKFDLAIQLKRLDLAYDLAAQNESAHKWRELGDLALAEWKISLAEKCFVKSGDLESLLLLFISCGNVSGLLGLAAAAAEQAKYNVAFSALFAAGRREECLDLLIKTERYPEAAFFAQSYLPSATERAVRLWREHLAARSHRAAKLIADPISNPQLFPQYHAALAMEEGYVAKSAGGGGSASASRTASGEGGSDHLARPRTLVFDPNHQPPLGGSGGASHDESSLSASGTTTTTHQLTTTSLASPYDGAAMSDHMSLEVNMGTNSVRADDLDDLASVTISETREDPTFAAARNLERLSIQELEEEHIEEGSFPAMSPPVAPGHSTAATAIHDSDNYDGGIRPKASSHDLATNVDSAEEDGFRTPPELFEEPIETPDKQQQHPQTSSPPEDAAPEKNPPSAEDIFLDEEDGWE